MIRKGEMVNLYYDGKLSRKVDGLVVGVRAQQIKVRFIPYGGPYNEIEAWFKRTNRKTNKYEGYANSEGLMPIMFDLPGDFYTVFLNDSR